MAKGKKIEIKHKGRTFWYYEEDERAMVEFTAEKKKELNGYLIAGMEEWIGKQDKDELYDAKLLHELRHYPEKVKEHFGVSTARQGKIADGSTESMINKMAPLQDSIDKSWYGIQQKIELEKFLDGKRLEDL